MTAPQALPARAPAGRNEARERVLEVDNLQTYFYTRGGLVKAVGE